MFINYRECQLEFPNICVKLLPSINRAYGAVEADIKLIIEMAKKYPEIIKGIDFSGGE